MAAQTLNYIILTNSNWTFKRRFRVIQGTLKPIIQGAQTLRRTTTGALDVQEGARWKAWEMTLKVYHTDPDQTVYWDGSQFGNQDDLETLAKLNNPASNPNNTLWFYENLDSDGDGVGDQHSVIMYANIEREPVTPYLTGQQAFCYVPILLERIAAIA